MEVALFYGIMQWVYYQFITNFMEQEIQPPPLNPIFPNNKNKTIAVLVSSLVAVFLATAGYFVFSNHLVKPPEIQTQQNVNISSWKTYRNEEYKFEFQYPNNWLVNYDEARYPESNESHPRFIAREPGPIQDSKCYASFIFKDAKSPSKYPYNLYSEIDKKQQCQIILDSIISTFIFFNSF